MDKQDQTDGNWEHLYTQFKNPEGDQVRCMVHKETKKLVCFDMKLNRVLTKREAREFRADVTGLHVAYQENGNAPALAPETQLHSPNAIPKDHKGSKP